VQGSI